MLIVCPQCATSYRVEPASLGADGRSVRCAHCRDVWFAAAPAVIPALAAVDELDVVDTGPKIPSFEARRPRQAEAAETPSPPVAADMPQSEQAESAPAESPGVAVEEKPIEDAAADAAVEEKPIEDAAADEVVPELVAAQTPQPEPASTEGINLEGLRQDMELEHAQQAAEADAVLAGTAAAEVPMEEAPPIAPAMESVAAAESQPAAPPDARDEVEAFAARRARRQAQRRKRQQWPLASLPTVILALVAVNAMLVAWRTDIVRLMPQMASLYATVGLAVNLRGLDFEDIRISKEEQEGMPVLVVEGSIVNVTRRLAEVPRLRLSLRNDGKNEIYSWTALPSRSILGPGEALPFRARLASPPAETHDVLVRFFTRRDFVAGRQ